MGQSLTAFGLAFLLGLLLSRIFHHVLSSFYSRERKSGKEKIHRLFPKPRRPLGGGLAIVLASTMGLLVAALLIRHGPAPSALWVLPLTWAYALIGLLDDLKKARGRGLADRSKFLLQLMVSLLYGFLLWRSGAGHDVRVPFAEGPVDFGLFYVPFAALVILATANAVNLSDGVDGLAAGAAAISLLGLAALGLLDPSRAVGPTCWPFIGAVLGFLVYNLPPARLLMGDTGALGIGAALAALAISAHAEFWLLLLGAPFVVNAASVLVQMGTVRVLWRMVRPLRHYTTEAARPFLCTPLHHHFQWLGWGDWPILALYWGLAAVMSAYSLLALRSGALWLVGMLCLGGVLAAAALQKLLSGSYFLGLLRRPEQPARLALYQGLPVEILGWPLHRLHYETSITEGMLTGATAEGVLWRLISEVEAHVLLGKIYADQRLLDEALHEWEEVPARNLLIRPSVVLRLARIYYGRDRLLEAIKLWEQLPASRLEDMPNLREVVRSAKIRLVDLAGKSHRQALQMMLAPQHNAEGSPRLEAYVSAARRFNQDLLSLLLYERDKLRGRSADPHAARTRREALRRTRTVVLERIQEMDQALAELARTSAAPVEDSEPPRPEPEERAAQELGITVGSLIALLCPAGDGRPRITQAAVHPKASRNTIYRLSLAWPDGGPRSVIAKRYSSERIKFFSACYQRERGVLELLHSYGCPVPRIYSSRLMDDQAILIMEDLGDETLAERLEASDVAVRQHWLRSAVSAMVALHDAARSHLDEIAAEIRKIAKEDLGPQYYSNALRIALERIVSLSHTTPTDHEWREMAEQARPLIDSFCASPGMFIHFEFTPHHLLVTEAGLRIFDFEQATIGPPEFDLAALLAQPESEIGPGGWQDMVQHYSLCASEAGLLAAGEQELQRRVAYATLFKCLVYAGAAANFLEKFGGEHHLQRFRYYLQQCQQTMQRWRALRPLGLLLASRFQQARAAAASSRTFSRPGAPG
jgi:phospho-N-acetylmuramoyl-pentapeptide-transferase